MLLKQQSQQQVEPRRIAHQQPQQRDRQVSFGGGIASSPHRNESFASSNLVNSAQLVSSAKLDRVASLRHRPKNLSKSLSHNRFVTARVLTLTCTLATMCLCVLPSTVHVVVPAYSLTETGLDSRALYALRRYLGPFPLQTATTCVSVCARACVYEIMCCAIRLIRFRCNDDCHGAWSSFFVTMLSSFLTCRMKLSPPSIGNKSKRN